MNDKNLDDGPGEFLGDGKDFSGRPFRAYSHDKSITIVYFPGTPLMFSRTKTLEMIQADPDSYLWTPFLDYAGL